MARLPVLKPRKVARVLEKIGFVEVRQRGSHKQLSARRRTLHNRSISRKP
jgi:predicted RNA binding protein YcfA (HicA-like mRNA interferase family)